MKKFLIILAALTPIAALAMEAPAPKPMEPSPPGVTLTTFDLSTIENAVLSADDQRHFKDGWRGFTDGAVLLQFQGQRQADAQREADSKAARAREEVAKAAMKKSVSGPTARPK